MNGPGAQCGFTLHLAFSELGLREAQAYVCAGDRVLCMYRTATVDSAGLQLACMDDPEEGATAGRDSPIRSDAPARIDFPTLVQWCADAARVISWP